MRCDHQCFNNAIMYLKVMESGLWVEAFTSLLNILYLFFPESGTRLGKTDLEEILLKDNGELRICHKLRRFHLDCKGSARQKVSIAAQLLSHTTATALRSLFPERIEQADVIETVDEWFDVFNSHKQVSKKKLGCAFGVHLSEQKFALNKMLQLISNCRFGQRKTLLPFQKGIIIGIQATVQLFNDLSSRFQLRYLLTARLNQDLVENFFSRIRALGLTFDHPGPVSCKNRIRILTITKEAEIVVKTSPVVMLDAPKARDKTLPTKLTMVTFRKLKDLLAIVLS